MDSVNRELVEVVQEVLELECRGLGVENTVDSRFLAKVINGLLEQRGVIIKLLSGLMPPVEGRDEIRTDVLDSDEFFRNRAAALAFIRDTQDPVVGDLLLRSITIVFVTVTRGGGQLPATTFDLLLFVRTMHIVFSDRNRLVSILGLRFGEEVGPAPVMTTRSVIQAFLFSPLPAALFLSAWGIVIVRRGPDGIGQVFGVLFVLYGLFCYAAAALVGVPLFLAFRRFGVKNLGGHVLGGAAAGAVFGVAVLVSGYGGSEALSPSRLPDILACTMAGGVSGLTFFMIATRTWSVRS